MREDRLLLNHELKVAQEKQTTKVSDYNKLLRELREYSKEFYFQVSIISAGVLSLSVTFIGYLTSKEQFQINYPELLYLGWFFVGLSLIGGLYRNYFHGHFGHWQAQTDLIKTYLKTEEAILKLVENYPDSFFNITTEEELEKFKSNKIKQIRVYNKNIKFNEEKEAIYLKLWKASQNLTTFGFGFGVTIIIIFAAFNLPIKIKKSFFIIK